MYNLIIQKRMKKMGTNDIKLQIVNDPTKAPNYNTDGQGFKAARLDTAIVVMNGTEGGYPTIDLQFIGQDGEKHIAMITANILKSICIAAGVVRP